MLLHKIERYTGEIIRWGTLVKSYPSGKNSCGEEKILSTLTWRLVPESPMPLTSYHVTKVCVLSSFLRIWHIAFQEILREGIDICAARCLVDGINFEHHWRCRWVQRECLWDEPTWFEGSDLNHDPACCRNRWSSLCIYWTRSRWVRKAVYIIRCRYYFPDIFPHKQVQSAIGGGT